MALWLVACLKWFARVGDSWRTGAAPRDAAASRLFAVGRLRDSANTLSRRRVADDQLRVPAEHAPTTRHTPNTNNPTPNTATGPGGRNAKCANNARSHALRSERGKGGRLL